MRRYEVLTLDGEWMSLRKPISPPAIHYIPFQMSSASGLFSRWRATRSSMRLIVPLLMVQFVCAPLLAQHAASPVNASSIPEPIAARHDSTPVQVLTLSDDQMQRAIEEGQRYRSRQEYLDNGLKTAKFQFASAWALDGISKYVTFFTDFEVVAAAAADAKREMRNFGLLEARKLPLEGFLYATMDVTGRGMLNVGKVKPRFGNGNARVVLQDGDSIIQPLLKKDPENASSNTVLGTGYLWTGGGNMGILTGMPLGFYNATARQDFAFAISPKALDRKIKAFLIDAEGNRYEKEIEISSLLHRCCSDPSAAKF